MVAEPWATNAAGRAGSAARHRWNEGQFVAVVQKLVGADVALVDGDHRRLDIITQRWMLVPETPPHVAGPRAVRKRDDFLASAGDLAEDGKEEETDFEHRRSF
jgi:hypothetical protein